SLRAEPCAPPPNSCGGALLQLLEVRGPLTSQASASWTGPGASGARTLRCRRYDALLQRVARRVDQHDRVDRNDPRQVGQTHQGSDDLHELPTLCRVTLVFGLCCMVWKITQ